MADECAPDDAELYRRLGEYLVERGRINDARQVFEKGIGINPMYAPLYHSLAELEARVCNLEGLALLDQRAKEIFNTNALEPPKSSSQAYGTKIRSKRSPHLPEGIAALAEKIVEEEDPSVLLGMDGIDGVDPTMMLESLNGSLMEDEFVDDLQDDL